MDAAQPPGPMAARRLVAKVGTSTLTAGGSALSQSRLDDLVRQLVYLRAEGREVILVTSGAIVTGATRLGLRAPPAAIAERQALAAVGQAILMHEYERRFADASIAVAQILLTADDLTARRRYRLAQDAFGVLLARGVVPIVNENDTVAVDEIKIGDNDTLSALVACMLDADLLCILSDVGGLHSADPRTDAAARLIPVVENVDDAVARAASGAGSTQGIGGMVTKLHAARIATAAGIPTVIADGAEPDVLLRLARGEALGTVFRPSPRPLRARQRWLAFAARPRGRLILDDGARRAVLEQGRSLLPAGVVGVEGRFEVGDLVELVDGAGEQLAVGLAGYDSGMLRRIVGARSERIAEVLGAPRAHPEAVHRDNLVVTQR